MSEISVFAKDTIHRTFDRIRDKKWGLWGDGTIPLIREWLALGMSMGS